MAVAAVALLAAGAIGATLVIRHGAASGEAAVAAAEATQAPPTAGTALGGHAGHGAPAAAPAAREAVAPGEVRLAPEALAQAGIRTARVESRAAAAVIEVPGVVTPNAYREVKVTPLVGGQVVEVHAELGAGIGRGAPLVTLFSSDLAEAQNRYLS
ncbi:MAG TPA: efflux RND transporter periplasmic adaptor subunit, partial [Methylomirabilota bacterium]|nr:efflux RND transporter periplasmic adaptor subunit [Methylomirabilota bacterium]